MIIFFYGEDTYRSKKAVNDLKNKFIKEINPQATNLYTLDGEKIDIANFEETIKNISLFLPKRLIIINSLFKNKKTTIFDNILETLKKIENKSDDIIIFYENEKISDKIKNKKEIKKLLTYLNKQKFSQEFKKLSETGQLHFVKKELDKYGKQITNSAAKFLLNSFSEDTWILTTELKKISFSVNKDIIGLEDIKMISNEIFFDDIFLLTDTISLKNKKNILEIFEKQKLAGLSDDFILSMLIRHFKILLQVKEAILKQENKENLAKRLGLHYFVIKKSLFQINKFEFNELKNILNKLIEIDYKNKSGKSNLSNELFSFIINI